MRRVLLFLALTGMVAGPAQAQWIIPFDAEFVEASHTNDVALLRAFLAKQSDVNRSGKDKTAFLQAAAYWGSTNAVQMLLDRGAKLEMQDQDGRTALHYAAIFNRCEMPSSFEEKEFAGFQLGKLRACEQLLKKGAQVNTTDKRGNTPLHWATTLRFWETVPGTTTEICALLLAHGADVSAANSLGETPLHLAAQFQLTNVCARLLEKGAKPNAKDNEGRTALHHALEAWYDHSTMIPLVELLLKAGADVNAQDAQGETVLDHARQLSFKEKDQLIAVLSKQQKK